MAYIGKVPTAVPLTSADLTDGIVTTAKISDNAVSVAKLTSALDFSSNTVTLPSGVGGKILQYAEDYDSASIGLSTTAWVDTNLSIAFTPVSASSKILVYGHVQVYVSGASAYFGSMLYKLQKDGSDFGEAFEAYTGYGGTEDVFNGMLAYSHSETSGSTTARTYKVQVKNPETPSGAHYNQYSGNSSLQILEIA